MHGQSEQAMRILKNLARRNGTSIPPGVSLREAGKTNSEGGEEKESLFLWEVMRVAKTRKWILIAVFCW